MYDTVALRKESVDRNQKSVSVTVPKHVALRKESVDRNPIGGVNNPGRYRSLSARRAWIEISRKAKCKARLKGRSPQGERG